jgi:hypothetical protein
MHGLLLQTVYLGASAGSGAAISQTLNKSILNKQNKLFIQLRQPEMVVQVRHLQ